MMRQKDWEQVKWKCLFNYIKLFTKCTIWRIYYKYVRYFENFYIINNLKDILVRIFFAISIQRVIKEDCYWTVGTIQDLRKGRRYLSNLRCTKWILFRMVQGWVRSTQGSVLGPLAFVIFINDLDDCIKQLTIVNKFADDTNLGHRIESDQDRETLQRCIDNLLIWAEDWWMEFNVKNARLCIYR